MIMHPSTDLNTMYTMLKSPKEAANTQMVTNTFLDMVLLPKALEMTFALPQELDGVIP